MFLTKSLGCVGNSGFQTPKCITSRLLVVGAPPSPVITRCSHWLGDSHQKWLLPHKAPPNWSSLKP